MRKLLLLAILAALGWWYFDGSRRLSETAIRESYQADLAAYNALDAEPLCRRMDAHFALLETINGTERRSDRESACSNLRRSFDAMRRMGFGSMPFEVETTIEDIALAPDRKSATVTATAVMRLADTTLMRVHTSERLIRRLGRIRSLGGENRIRAYSRQ